MVSEEEENEVRKSRYCQKAAGFLPAKRQSEQTAETEEPEKRPNDAAFTRKVVFLLLSSQSRVPAQTPHPRQHSRFADPKPAARPGAENAARPPRLGPTNKVCSRRRSLSRWVPVREFRFVGGYWSVRQPTAANV